MCLPSYIICTAKRYGNGGIVIAIVFGFINQSESIKEALPNLIRKLYRCVGHDRLPKSCRKLKGLTGLEQLHAALLEVELGEYGNRSCET